MKKRNLLIVLFVGLVVVAMIGAGILLAVSFGKGRVPGKTILEADFETAIPEYVPADPIAELLQQETLDTRAWVDALHQAANDDRVAGFVATIGQGSYGFAQLNELRDAILAFRESGKPAIAFSETFAEMSGGNAAYYLASAFDEIYLQPSGDVNLHSIHLESPFLAGTLEKLGMEPRLDHRYEYKNAMNVFTETEYTDAHREAMRTLMTSLYDHMIVEIAESRGMSVDEIDRLFKEGPFLGQEAVDAGLVDGLAYRDEAYDKIRERAGEKAKLLYVGPYLEKIGRPHEKGRTVALVYGVGNVTRGESEYNALTGGQNMGSATVAAALRAAIDDDDVEAIVFRVDSPGGSYIASDTILRETLRARDAGKPVIVTMGNVAASGGYFVSLAADKIVAQPGTITGSIGVVGGKVLTRETMNKIGVTFDHVETGDNATFWSSNHDYTDEQWAKFQTWLDRVYEDFTTKVAEGRDMPLDEVREIAKGRVWTGLQAKENGLVDELGGFDVALRLAREAIGLAPDAEIELELFPRKRSPWDELFGQGPESSESAAATALAQVLEAVRPAVRLAQRAGLYEPYPRTLTLPAEMVPTP